MRLPRRLALAAPALLLTAAARKTGATLVVGAPPGTAADLQARAFAPFLERHWGRGRIAVVNRPGARGLDAAEAVAGAPAGPPELLAVTMPVLLARAIEAGRADLLERLDFAAALLEEPILLAGRPGRPAARLLGGPLPPLIGCAAPGTAGHLAALRLAELTAIEILPFPSAIAAREAAIAGHVAAALLSAADAAPALRDGRLVGLALAFETRAPGLPDIPTFAELGLPLRAVIRRGVALPTSLPDRARAGFDAALAAASRDPDLADQAMAWGGQPALLGRAAWSAEIARTRAELSGLWSQAPWLSRRL